LEENLSAPFKKVDDMIGIISDSHDRITAIQKAVEYLNSKDVELVIHAGDIIAPFTVPEFKKLKAKLVAVFGNNDGEKKGLTAKFSEINTTLDDLAEVNYKGKKIAVYHGTVKAITEALIESGKYDVVITGHTHNAEVRKEGNTLLINPGELCGYLTGKRTLCLLDIERMEAKIVEI
jgi:hypothetical protein